MYELTKISHSVISSVQLDQIIQIKSVAWPYPYIQQQEWVKNNLKDTDIHVMLMNELHQPVAYLNLITIELLFDSIPVSAYGVGNVCALERGHGWGKELILRTNEYLINQHKIGLLFCKEALVNFYKKNNWTLIPPETLTSNVGEGVHTMLFDSTGRQFNKLEYHGKLF